MSGRFRILFLVGIMMAVAASFGGMMFFALYEAALAQQRERLIETARSQVRIIEAIAQHEMRYEHLIGNADDHGDAFTSTIGQLREAHKRFRGFGETGEFTLARREGDQIIFILRHRHDDLDEPRPVLFSSGLAIPMRLALSGKSGAIMGLDYRGELVLAAHEPVEELGLGVVAKIDMAEVRAPFIKAGILAAVGGIALAILGTVLFFRIGNPIVQDIEVRVKELDYLFGVSRLVEASGVSLENILQGAVELIPPALQYPDIACARIVIDKQEFITDNFEESNWKHAIDISVHDDRVGSLEVYYLEQRPEKDEGPFLKGERALLDDVCKRLGRVIERIRTEQELEDERKQLLSMFDGMEEVIYVADPDTYELLYMNNTAKDQWGEKLGQECYRVLQNRDSPCPFCTNDYIFGEHIGQSYTWEFHNLVNRFWYRCIDRAIHWPDGRMVRFEMAVDITGLKQAEEQVRLLSAKVLEAHELERKLVAQEIHDSIGASLAAIKYGLEKKLGEMGEMPYSGKASLEQIIVTVQDSIEESRRISTNLRPSLLDDLGLLPTIRWFCREFQNIYSDIRIESQIDIQENQVPEPLKIVIFRILQEALNNIAKHSGADLVHLSLDYVSEEIVLNIDDNGKGFDVEEAESSKGSAHGLGLLSMNDRAELSGGLFKIQSTKGAGTNIMASWPTV